MSHNVKMDVYQYLPQITRHMENLVKSRCFPDLLATGFYPNAKELTESMGAYEGVRKYFGTSFPFSDPSITLISIADGVSPRTGALFALRSAWDCWSIDPKLREEKWGIKRLHGVRAKVEDLTIDKVFDKLIIVCVHTHARLQDVCAKFKAKHRVILVIPCCVKQERERVPDITYHDLSIWSPCNKVMIWEDNYDKETFQRPSRDSSPLLWKALPARLDPS